MARNEEACDMDTTCDLLDKMILNQLHLIEDKMRTELILESNINNGSFHLAKSRYIMGQNSVGKERLPTELSSEFSASIATESINEDYDKQFRIVEKSKEEKSSVINPLNWFGVLVPQNLRKAQEIFKNAIDHIVECANIQSQIIYNIKAIEILKIYKSSLTKV